MSRLFVTPRDSRAIVLGALTVLGLWLGIRGIPRWLSWRAELIDRTRQAQLRAAETERLLAAFPAAVDSLARRTTALELKVRDLVVADSAGAAAAVLAGLVVDAARASLVRLDSVRVRVIGRDSLSLPQLVLEATTATDIAGLTSLLERLESGKPRLAVRQLAVRPANVAVATDQVETLQVGLSVEGLALLVARDSSR